MDAGESKVANVRYLSARFRGGALGRPRVGDRQSRQENTEKRTIHVFNARPRHAEWSLDTNAFVLTPHESKVTRGSC